MPTHRRRHAITETDDISLALKVAERRWPSLKGKPGALLRQLILEGRTALEEADRAANRIGDIEATRGALADVYGRNYLAELREDWPA
jgi:hypothetical protein